MTRHVEFSDRKYAHETERFQPFKRFLLDEASAQSPGRLLDIGCGTGLISAEFRRRGWEVVGLDISPVALRRYRDGGGAGLIANIEQGLPFADGCFDAVWMSEVLEHVVATETVLTSIRRVLRPGGRLFLSTPNSAYYGYRALALLGYAATETQHPLHVRFFSYASLKRALATAGVRPVQVSGQNVWFVSPDFSGPLRRLLPGPLWSAIAATARRRGFRRSEGLVHGDKILLASHSSTLNAFFSNAILVVATTENPPSV